MSYKITDSNGEEIQGSFYEQELQTTAQVTSRIEKVLKRQSGKSLVKGMGYPKSFNSWIDTKTKLKLNTENRFKTVEKKKFIQTCFNNYDKVVMRSHKSTRKYTANCKQMFGAIYQKFLVSMKFF